MAVQMPGELGDRRAVPVLVDALLDFERDGVRTCCWQVQRAAAVSLGQLRDSAAVESLGRVLTLNYIRDRVIILDDVRKSSQRHWPPSAGSRRRAAEFLREIVNTPRTSFGDEPDRTHRVIVKALEIVEKNLAGV